MKTDLDYLYQKLDVVVDVLATGTGTIQKRLYSAYVSCAWRMFKLRDFPVEMHYLYKAIEAALTDHSAADSAKTEAIVMALSDHDASQVAGNFFKLYREVSDARRVLH